MSAPATPPLRFLIVDDDDVDRMSIRRALTRAGITATIDEASDALDALALIASESYDCVFLDYNIPHGDGLTLLRGIHRARLVVPVVILSGQDDAGVTAELMAAGAVDYIAKDSLRPARVLESLARAGIALAPREAT